MTPYEKGCDDFTHGTSENPYPVGTTEHDEWRRGYDDQKRKDELEEYWDDRDTPPGP